MNRRSPFEDNSGKWRNIGYLRENFKNDSRANLKVY